jgi:hypothetical protein
MREDIWYRVQRVVLRVVTRNAVTGTTLILFEQGISVSSRKQMRKHSKLVIVTVTVATGINV